MYLCTRNYDLKRGGTFETAKAGTFHSVTAGTLIPLSPIPPNFYPKKALKIFGHFRKNIYLCSRYQLSLILGNTYDATYWRNGISCYASKKTRRKSACHENGYTYYDHALTPIDIKKLLRSIDEIKRPFASKESSINGEQASDVLSECKDKRLISILQIK